jgi:hypothetical protein
MHFAGIRTHVTKTLPALHARQLDAHPLHVLAEQYDQSHLHETQLGAGSNTREAHVVQRQALQAAAAAAAAAAADKIITTRT